MNVNKLILEISYLFCCIGPIVILIIRNINDLRDCQFFCVNKSFRLIDSLTVF